MFNSSIVEVMHRTDDAELLLGDEFVDEGVAVFSFSTLRIRADGTFSPWAALARMPDFPIGCYVENCK
jgi:hypothetical protein